MKQSDALYVLQVNNSFECQQDSQSFRKKIRKNMEIV